MNNSIRLGIPLLGLAASVIFLGGCADESPWGSTSAETGTINVTLSADYSFDTAKPIFRSSDDSRAQGDDNDLSTYITLPDLDDFSFKLVPKDGSSEKVWTTLSAFEDALKTEKFGAGIYTLTAYYGEKGKQGVDCPYFEATSTFTVLAGRETKIDLTAELKNSMVKINYSDGFKDYMSAYSASVLSGGDKIDAGAVSEENDVVDTDKVIFVEPEDTEIAVDFTTRITGQSVSGLVVGKFATLAKTLHNVTLDVTDGDNGFAQLTVTFEENYVDKEEVIDLTETLYTTPAPTISCSGFSNGETINLYGDAAVDASVSMSVLARGGIKKAILGVIAPDGYVIPWGSTEIDLHDAANVSAVSNFGVIAKGFDSEDESNAMATLDLTSFARNLPQGAEYTVYLTVTDTKNQASDPVKVVLNTEAVSAMLAKDESQNSLTPDIVYGSDVAELTLDFNGENPRDVSFQARNENGSLQDVTAELVSYEQLPSATRAFSTKRCLYRVSLPYSTCSEVSVSAKYKGATLQSFTIPVAIPEYSISEVDAFAHYAYLKIDADPSVLSLVTENIRVMYGDENINIEHRDASKGIVTITNLTPSSSYSLKSSITDGNIWNSTVEFKTELDTSIKYGDFEQLKPNPLTCGENNLQVGGQYWASNIKKYINLSYYEYFEPEGWTTINSETANLDSQYIGKEKYDSSNWEKDLNSWYVVPSSWADNGRGYMRNVGYNHNGPHISGTSGANGSSNYYCKNRPAETDLMKAPGELKLEQQNFNRPSSILFDYEYKPIKSDTGYAFVSVEDRTGNIIAENSLYISSGSQENQEITLRYAKKGASPYKLIVIFRSSSKGENSPITIPDDPKDPGSGSGAPKYITKNEYKSVAVGSQLWVDNVKAVYANSPSESSSFAPKRKFTKNRK